MKFWGALPLPPLVAAAATVLAASPACASAEDSTALVTIAESAWVHGRQRRGGETEGFTKCVRPSAGRCLCSAVPLVPLGSAI